MRTAFIETLCAMAAEDPRIWLVTGDLGYSVVEGFADSFPERFVNAGVAEQNMTGLAAGLALSGNVVFTYSIANFPTLRCLEQIRNDVCFHAANVKIVAVGGGFVYGSQGHTHHALEDLSIMRSLPGMTVLAPGDPAEARWATRAIVDRPGPCYLRLGRAGEPHVHPDGVAPDLHIGKACTVRAGSDVTLISCGGMLKDTVEAADLLSQRGVEARVLSMHTVKPLDADAVLAAARETRAIISVEEHRRVGGLGSAIAEVLAPAGVGSVAFRSVGVEGDDQPAAGSQAYLRSLSGLTSSAIAEVAFSLVCG